MSITSRIWGLRSPALVNVRKWHNQDIVKLEEACILGIAVK